MLADPSVTEYIHGAFLPGLLIGGGATLLRWQAETALWVIAFNIIVTFILLKLIGLVVALRHTDEELEIGDHAIHGHEVYPADVATLGHFG